MKILIAGGHLSPAIAVIEELKKKHEVVYVGRKYAMEGDNALSLEYQTVPGLGIKFEEINPGRLQRYFTRHTIPSLMRLPRGYKEAFHVIKRIKPDIVLGFGGYVQLPIIIGASLLRIPVVIHEQTFEAGLSNKLSSKFAKFICVSHKSSLKFFPKNKTIITGNPVRADILQSEGKIKQPSGSDPLIYITGGSLGSHFINELVLEQFEVLLDKCRIIHQSGDAKKFNDFEKLSKKKEELGKLGEKYLVFKFLDPSEVGFIMKNADLVVSRGGANTITELYILGKPSLVIPLPFGDSKEQIKNAKFLKESGLAEVLDQKNLDASSFLDRINDMIKNINKYKRKEELEIPIDSVGKIISVLEDAASKKTNSEKK